MSLRLPIYLDNNATTPVDERVLAAMLPTFQREFGNPSSGTHAYGWYAAELIEIAREQVAALIGAAASEIIFTSGATESNNIAIKGIAEHATRRGLGAHIVTAAAEHRAVLDVAQHLQSGGVELTVVPVQSDGTVDPQRIIDSLRDNTAVVSVMLANNEVGAINDIPAIAAVIKDRGIAFHCDATQAPGKIRIDVNALGVDLLSLSAHKMYGPKGAGALYIRRGFNRLESFLDGGGQERGIRSGTLNVHGIVGIGSAASLAWQQQDVEGARLRACAQDMYTQLCKTSDPVTLNGPPITARLPGNLNIAFEGVDNVKLLAAVGHQVAVSVSSACQSQQKHPSHVLAALGLTEQRQRSSIRIGIGRFTTPEELAFATESITAAIRKLRR